MIADRYKAGHRLLNSPSVVRVGSLEPSISKSSRLEKSADVFFRASEEYKRHPTQARKIRGDFAKQGRAEPRHIALNLTNVAADNEEDD
jgi:hypothetical protein